MLDSPLYNRIFTEQIAGRPWATVDGRLPQWGCHQKISTYTSFFPFFFSFCNLYFHRVHLVYPYHSSRLLLFEDKKMQLKNKGQAFHRSFKFGYLHSLCLIFVRKTCLIIVLIIKLITISTFRNVIFLKSEICYLKIFFSQKKAKTRNFFCVIFQEIFWMRRKNKMKELNWCLLVCLQECENRKKKKK